jgi:hypothetical protein
VSAGPLHTNTRVVLGAMGAALLVLVLGIAAAVTHDDTSGGRAPNGRESTDRSVTTVPPTTGRGSTSTSTSRPRTTLPPSSTTSTSPSTSSTVRGLPGTTTASSAPVRATVASPEAAANGLIAAYRNDDRNLAGRFATPEVVDVLFQQPYVQADDPGFQGCRPDGTDFVCTYLQPTVRYDMSARGNSSGEFRIIGIDVRQT